jgi:hypothetical protein
MMRSERRRGTLGSMTVARTITLGPWEFSLTERSGEWFISVPDCGGMVDSFPRVPEQHAWAERTFAGQPGLVQIWPTVWRVEAGALPALERLLREHGARWPEP